MKSTISLLCTLGYINAQTFDYASQGADWSMGTCNSGMTMSPIEIPLFTEVVDEKAEEGAEKEYTSKSKNQKYVEKRVDYDLSANWDSSGKVAVFTGDDSGEGILGYRFTSSKDSAATYITLTDVVKSVNEAGEEVSTDVDVIDKSDLISLVVRSPSEHTLNGEYQDVEVQYFYESTTTDGKFSALSVFYSSKGNAESDLLKLILGAKSTTFKLATYNNSIINENSSFIKYDGQYTNPRNAGRGEIGDSSCEAIQWVILQDVQPMSVAQKDSFSAKWMDNENFLAMETYGNNRKIQPLKQRKIYSNKYVGSGATFIAAGLATFAALASTFAL